ncbi:hypothetical protein B0H10DRAFT_633580 [Mycena sp. CBHHK59/15]|nr:hypothetical protein B0H10DRAFT_633580 [Mycena sp. CBHHK59/15]
MRAVGQVYGVVRPDGRGGEILLTWVLVLSLILSYLFCWQIWTHPPSTRFHYFLRSPCETVKPSGHLWNNTESEVASATSAYGRAVQPPESLFPTLPLHLISYLSSDVTILKLDSSDLSSRQIVSLLQCRTGLVHPIQMLRPLQKDACAPKPRKPCLYWLRNSSLC